MNRKPKTQRRRVKALTDPQPELVSMVYAGANMTPFKAVKSEDAIKADTHTVVKVAFRGEKFADEAAVTTWLVDGGYENYQIAKTDEGFEVKSAEADEIDDSEIAVIEMEGLSMFVMKLDEPTGELADKQPSVVDAPEEAAKADAAEATAEEATEEAAEAVEAEAVKAEEAATEEAAHEADPEMRVKFDDMMAAYSNKDTLMGVLADGFNGLPPGFFELTGAMYTAMRNACMGGDLEGVRRIAVDYGNMVASVAAMFPLNDESGMGMAQRTELFNALAPELALAPVTVAEKTVEQEVADEDILIAAAEGEAVQPVAKDEDATEEAVSETEIASEETEAEHAVKADTAKGPLDVLVNAVAQLTDQVGSLHKDLTTKADALAVRVDAIEGRQTRKSADVEEDVQASPDRAHKSGSKEFSQLALRGALGIARKND